MKKQIGGLILLTMIAGCAGRDAVPISRVQSGDSELSCTQIEAEQQQIAQKVNGLIKEDEEAHNRNIAVGVVGAILFWPALFALDTGDAEETEIAALRSRSDHLNGLALQKHCHDPNNVEPAPTQPVSAPSASIEPASPVTKCFWNSATKRNVCATN